MQIWWCWPCCSGRYFDEWKFSGSRHWGRRPSLKIQPCQYAKYLPSQKKLGSLSAGIYLFKSIWARKSKMTIVNVKTTSSKNLYIFQSTDAGWTLVKSRNFASSNPSSRPLNLWWQRTSAQLHLREKLSFGNSTDIFPDELLSAGELGGVVFRAGEPSSPSSARAENFWRISEKIKKLCKPNSFKVDENLQFILRTFAWVSHFAKIQ